MKTLANRIFYGLAVYGASQLVGVPIVGNILATALQTTAAGLDTVADFIQYQTTQEMNADLASRLRAGAVVTKITPYRDGTVGVLYDNSNYIELSEDMTGVS